MQPEKSGQPLLRDQPVWRESLVRQHFIAWKADDRCSTLRAPPVAGRAGSSAFVTQEEAQVTLERFSCFVVGLYADERPADALAELREDVPAGSAKDAAHAQLLRALPHAFDELHQCGGAALPARRKRTL